MRLEAMGAGRGCVAACLGCFSHPAQGAVLVPEVQVVTSATVIWISIAVAVGVVLARGGVIQHKHAQATPLWVREQSSGRHARPCGSGYLMASCSGSRIHVLAHGLLAIGART